MLFPGKKLTAFLALLLVLVPFGAQAQNSELDDILSGFEEPAVSPAPENSGLDEVLSGFEEETAQGTATTPDASRLPDWLELSGGIGFSTSWTMGSSTPPAAAPNLDHHGLSRLRWSADLTADIALPAGWQARIGTKGFHDPVFALRGREDYPAQVLRRSESELELTESYLQGTLSPRLDIKSGRQIVVWGKSDNIRLTDVLNPLDNREPGMVDIRDLRLPVAMTKLDSYLGAWNLSGIVVHEPRFHKTPGFGSDFFAGTSPAPPEEIPATSWENQEYGLALNGHFQGWDLSLYGARIFDDMGHVAVTASGPRLVHNRITMLGAAANLALGNWLLKSEAAWFDGLEYSLPADSDRRLDLLLGAEYMGFPETVLSLEVANRHTFSFDPALEAAPVYGVEDDLQTVLRLSRDFRHDTVQLTLLLSIFGADGDGGSFERLTVRYELSDSLTATGGIILYQDGDRPLFRHSDQRDRLFAELRYSF